MLINCYKDHVAYTFENEETIFQIGMRVLKKNSNPSIIQPFRIMYNGKVRLLYGIEGYEKIANMIDNISRAELIVVFRDFLNSIKMILENDYLDCNMVDINFQRLYYDKAKKALKFAVLPLEIECNFHDNLSWNISFRNTIAIFVNYLLKQNSQKYAELYYFIFDENQSIEAIITDLLKYDYEACCQIATTAAPLDAAHEVQEVRVQALPERLVIEHHSILGDLVFVIYDRDYILGKSSSEADGVIKISTAVSRKHCKISKRGNGYVVVDLNSTNGTSLNGKGLVSMMEYYLKNGDILQISDVTFTITITD